MASKPPPKRKKRPATKLTKMGGRCFCVGYTWVARMKEEQATGKSEDEAATKLLKKLGVPLDE